MWADGRRFMKTIRFLLLLSSVAGAAFAQTVAYKVVGDGIAQSLTGKPGDAMRGRALLAGREAADCLQCHAVKRDQVLAAGGGRGPALDGVGSALTPAQLRLSVADYSQVSRGTSMPTFHRADSRSSSGPLLTAEQVEDVVAYLSTLKNK
jgi:sulfur-oxidizing protein SoxX